LERVSIYIDGGNFYHLVLKKLGLKESDFDFGDFDEYEEIKKHIKKNKGKLKRLYTAS